MDWDKAYKHLKIQNWLILLILVFASLFFFDKSFTTGIILGGLAITANFSLLQSSVSQAFGSSGVMKPKKASILLKYYFRLVALGALIYFLVTKQLVHPLGFLSGLSVVYINIFMFGIFDLFKNNKKYGRKAV